LIDKNFNKLFYQKYNIFPKIIIQKAGDTSIEMHKIDYVKFQCKTPLISDKIKNDILRDKFSFIEKLSKLENSQQEDNKELFSN